MTVPQILGIEPAGQRGRADQIAEHHGQLTPLGSVQRRWLRDDSRRRGRGLAEIAQWRAAASGDRRGRRRALSGPRRSDREGPRNRYGSRRNARRTRTCQAIRATLQSAAFRVRHLANLSRTSSIGRECNPRVKPVTERAARSHRSLFFLHQRLQIPQPLRPAFLDGLRRPLERQRIRRHVLGDDRARADIGAVADLDRRDQRRVRADERALADVGAVLGRAVVVAGDGAGADIGARADARVADVGSDGWPWRRPRSSPP